jgi:hypothetical protein
MKLRAGSPSYSSGRLPLVPFVARHAGDILALVPLAFLIGAVCQYAVAVPFWDQWELVPLLDKTYHGSLTFSDLWAQHNEHRLLFPQIIMLALARLTHWDIRYELALNLLLALGIFAVFIHQVRITARKLGPGGLRWAVPVIALIVFSLAQYQNWLWGWQMQMFLNLLAVVGGIVLLAHETFQWRRFAFAALLGIVATYSFADGLLFWPLGFCLIFVVTAGTKRVKAALAGWTLISVLTLASYFYHYQKPEGHPPLSLVFKMPLEYAAFVLKYTGNLCAQNIGGSDTIDGTFALIFGLAALVAFGWTIGMLLRQRMADARSLLPYLGMSLYSLGSALMTGIGRIGFGSNQALYSRYGTMMVPFWVALVVFLFLLRGGDAQTADAAAASKPGRGWQSPAVCRIIAGGSLLAAVTLLLLGSVCALAGVQQFSRSQAYGRNALLNLAAHPGSDIDYRGLSLLYPRPHVLLQRCPVLLQHQLSVFRNPRRPAASP